MQASDNITFNEAAHADSDYPRIVDFPGYADIILGDEKPGIYYQCNTYNSTLYKNLEEYWHQILLYHDGRYRKMDILRQFVKYFPNEMFNPVAYRNGKQVDQFLIRLTKTQMNTLFTNHLKIMMNDGKFIFLKVKINVAKAHSTHIEPLSKIRVILDRQFKRCERIGEFKVLNLNNLYEKTREIFITMANVPTFEMICVCLIENQEIAQTIKGLKLQSNSIKSLRPLAVLQSINIGYLDLSMNEIDRLDEISHLKPVRLKELKILGNPVSGTKLVLEKIKEILPSLINVDGRSFKPVIETIEPKQSGDMYDTMALVMGNFNIAKYMKSNKWHQIIVLHDGRCTKNKILETLFEVCQDTEFYPCYYKEGKQSDLFFVRNCLDAINAIKNTELKLTIDDLVLPMRLIMNAKDHDSSEIDPVNAISEELNLRYNLIDKTLNLSSFAIQTLAKNLIINIANSKILTHVLILAQRKFGSNIQHMKLAGNGIRSVKGLFPIFNIKSLTSLDLSDNKIEECNELFTMVAKLKLTDLRLANNPFCKNINGHLYVSQMKKIFPSLETLDGFLINENAFTFNKNYLCNLEYYDFVQKFIKNYFRIFDSQVRYQIIDFYHTKAIYSMSMNYDKSKITVANSARISKHSSMSRNILKCADFRHYGTNLLIGDKIIVSYISNLPITEHDYNSFSVDVTYADEEMICITVNGMLKELGSTIGENELWFGFMRTFVLRAQNKHAGFLKGGTDYTISNEQMHLFNLNILQIKNGFKTIQPGTTPAKGSTDEAANIEIPHRIDVKYENECLNKIFMEITKLKHNWSIRCLKRMDWKLLPAFQYFLRLEEFDKIPKIAYDQNKK